MIGKILSGIGNVLDLPGSMARDALALQNPFDQLMTPFSDQNRMSGRDLLRHHNLIGSEDNWGNYLGGMAAEAVLDPTNLIPGGMLAKYAMKLRGTKAANAGIDAANALSKQQRAMGFMPEEIAKLTKVVDPATGMPKRMYHGTSRVYEKPDLSLDSGANLYGRGYYTSDNPSVVAGDGGYHQKGLAEAKNKAYRSDPKYLQMEHHADQARQIAKHYAKELNKYPFDGAPDVVHKQFDKAFELRDKITERLGSLREEIPYNSGISPNVRMQYLDVRNPFNMDSAYPVDEINRIQRTGLPNANYSDVADFNGNITGDFFARKIASDANVFNSRLKSAGYDGITHTGGKVTDGVPHNVVIAFDPSQVYKPYIAKSLKDRVPNPKRPRIGGGLTAYHALARGGHGQ